MKKASSPFGKKAASRGWLSMAEPRSGSHARTCSSGLSCCAAGSTTNASRSRAPNYDNTCLIRSAS